MFPLRIIRDNPPGDGLHRPYPNLPTDYDLDIGTYVRRVYLLGDLWVVQLRYEGHQLFLVTLAQAMRNFPYHLSRHIWCNQRSLLTEEPDRFLFVRYYRPWNPPTYPYPSACTLTNRRRLIEAPPSPSH